MSSLSTRQQLMEERLMKRMEEMMTILPNSNSEEVKHVKEARGKGLMWSFVYQNISIIKLSLAIVQIPMG